MKRNMNFFIFLCLCISSYAASISVSYEEELRDWNFQLSAKELADNQWEEYKLKYKKHYKTKTEELYRKKIFLENSIQISEENQLFAKGRVHTEQEVNNFADLTNEEITETYASCFSGYEEYFNSNETEDVISFIPPAHVTLPDSVDWREKGAVTNVMNQGRCGACYAFSATGSLEGQHFRKEEELVSLSEQNLVDCSSLFGNKGCRGGLPIISFIYIKANGGIDTEESYPYEAKLGKCRYDAEKKGATDIGISMIKNGDEDALKSAVATSGPIAVGIDGSRESFHHYKPGNVYYDPQCSSTNLTHAVLVVGYGTDPDDKNPDYWIAKNSWGEGWGDKGYIKMARNKNNHCGIATLAAYPVV